MIRQPMFDVDMSELSAFIGEKPRTIYEIMKRFNIKGKGSAENMLTKATYEILIYEACVKGKVYYGLLEH